MTNTEIIDEIADILWTCQRSATDYSQRAELVGTVIGKLEDLGQLGRGRERTRRTLMPALTGRLRSYPRWVELVKSVVCPSKEPQPTPTARITELLDIIATDLHSAQVYPVVNGQPDTSNTRRLRLEAIATLLAERVDKVTGGYGGESFAPIVLAVKGPVRSVEDWREFAVELLRLLSSPELADLQVIKSKRKNK